MSQPSTVIIQQNTISVGPESTRTTCPSCRASIATRVEYINSTKTHVIAVILCLVFCPCVCLPYCINSCKNANHYCPNCSAFIGTYK